MEAFIGTIILFAGDYAPHGWAFCDGTKLPTAQNNALFQVIGTKYGGDATTFALPDLRGRMAMGIGQGPGLTQRMLGQAAGTEAVALLPQQMPAHNHTLLATDQFGNSGAPSGAALASTDDPNTFLSTSPVYKQAAPNTALHPGSVGVVGGSQPHDNMPPFLALNYIICLEGLFPSRD